MQRYTLYHNATHCNTLRPTATHCGTLQHTATHCNTLQRKSDSFRSPCWHTLQHTATHCNTLQHAVRADSLRESNKVSFKRVTSSMHMCDITHRSPCMTCCPHMCDMPQASVDTAPHCNILQLSETHRNTHASGKSRHVLFLCVTLLYFDVWCGFISMWDECISMRDMSHDDGCFFNHSWRNNVVIAFATLSSDLQLC